MTQDLHEKSAVKQLNPHFSCLTFPRFDAQISPTEVHLAPATPATPATGHVPAAVGRRPSCRRRGPMELPTAPGFGDLEGGFEVG